jgi:hypothetical protein
LSAATEWAHRLGGKTSYVTLVTRIERWREMHDGHVTYVTFNYDRLLDEALGDFVLDLEPEGETIADGYVSDDRTALIKAHGSVDWWHRVEGIAGPQPRREIATRALDAPISEAFLYHRATAGPYIPALAVPTTLKDGFTCPDAHRERLMRDLPNVDRILSIGWAGNDTELLRCMAELGKVARRLEVVTSNPGSAQVVLNRFVDAGVRAENHYRAPGGFSAFVALTAWESLGYWSP